MESGWDSPVVIMLILVFLAILFTNYRLGTIFDHFHSLANILDFTDRMENKSRNFKLELAALSASIAMIREGIGQIEENTRRRD